MKTVMKKMFSLLLVAVMLIGIMPFQASAAATKVADLTSINPGYNIVVTEVLAEYPNPSLSWIQRDDGEKYTSGEFSAAEGHTYAVYTDLCLNGHDFNNGVCQRDNCGFHCPHSTWSAGTVTKAATCTAPGETTYVCSTCGHNHIDTTLPAATDHSYGSDSVCDNCGYCNNCQKTPCECVVTKTVKAVLKQNGSADITKTEDRASDWSASVEAILTNWFKADTALFYSASVNGSAVGLTDLVKAGDELIIQLVCSQCRQHPCICCSECDGTTTNHSRNCPTLQNNTGKVKVYMNLNYGNAYAYGEEMEYVWADKNELLKDVVADLAEPSRDGHYFQYWTTRDGTVIDRYNKEDRATADGVMIYAQWVDNIQSDSGTVDVTADLMYSGLKEHMNNIVSGVEMGNVLEYFGTPVRLNYKFLGWYWDKNCTDKVESEEKIYQDRTIYAKWEYRDTNNDILLKVYLNGNTHTPVRTIDMYKYTRDDGYISMSEVKEAVKLYYTGKNTDGMYFDGLYDSTEWLKYVDNKKTADAEGSIEMEYEPGVDTIVYVMVQNAKARSYTASTSSSTTAKADSSNPKTGDAIYAPIMIMGASVSALAVLFYLNKKRAF